MSVGIGCCSCFGTNWVVIKFCIAEKAFEMIYLPVIYAPTDAKPTRDNTHGLLHERLGVGAMVFKSWLVRRTVFDKWVLPGCCCYTLLGFLIIFIRSFDYLWCKIYKKI